MRRVASLLLALTAVGCTTPPTPRSADVRVLDDVGGASHAAVGHVRDHEVRVEAADRVGDCVLRNFVVTPGTSTEESHAVGRIETPGETRGSMAVLHLWPSEDTTVTARYVHTVLVDSGSRRQPENEPAAVGSGEMRVGRPLSNGFWFDHYDFATEKKGYGGASASVKEASRPGSDQASLLIRWYVDPYSSVRFSWKLFATGPCRARP